MNGWIVPPPKDPTKTKEDFQEERAEKVRRLVEEGLLRSERIQQALLSIPREEFIPPTYRDYAYLEVPLPLPGKRATISCPHSYPLFYEPLGLDEGHRFLEVGLGSGYGAAVAREVVGPTGLVVSIEIDPITYAFARSNLDRLGYKDVITIQADGGLGHPDLAPYDRICLTAACQDFPVPLIQQLKMGGRVIAPVVEQGTQNLVLGDKRREGLMRAVICEVLYVDLRGRYGSEA